MSIKVSQLSKNYASQKALNHVSFTIEKGEIVGFLGPNGAGKSTLMKILSGYIKDFEGKAFIDGVSVAEFPIETQKNIGYLPEHNPLYKEMYVKEYLDFNAQIYQTSQKSISETIDEVGLKSHVGKKIKELSKGYRQRVGLAAAMLHNPKVLILDEPTTGLDPNQLVEIRQLIKKWGAQKTVLFSTHILQEVEAVCDRVIIINQGEIVADRLLQDVKGKKEQVVIVEFDTTIQKEFLENLSNIARIYQLSDTKWKLNFSGKEDQRASVFDFAQSNALKILSLSQENNNLESLFRELTQT